jgi:DMSO/TMAO reductase YedYZ molybdopterin-dependent catalytic subunit
VAGRREVLASLLMPAGTMAVAGEAFLRNRQLAQRAVTPRPLYSFSIPGERLTWGQGLVRKPLTPLREFYVMSKNTVDPAPDPTQWRLRVMLDERLLRQFTYAELLSLPRTERFVSLRCVSNTLKSDLMGTASWSGILLEQLVRRTEIPGKVVEMAVVGLDGHGDSFRLDYAFSGEPLLALGMNGETLNRLHGFPVRLLTPRYYGFKSIKWLDEIRFTTEPYVGTWPKLGYTKEPLIHTGTFIDRMVAEVGRIRAGGIAYSGAGAIEQVEVRLDGGEWKRAQLEPRLSPYTFTRWTVEVPAMPGGKWLEARALDATGQWQSAVEKPLFPDGVSGPTRKRLPGA